jgi:hypothetical protein
MWDKSGANTEADFQKLVEKSTSAEKISSPEEAIAVRKFKNMMVKAFDLGLYDANRNPCPF